MSLCTHTPYAAQSQFADCRVGCADAERVRQVANFTVVWSESRTEGGAGDGIEKVLFIVRACAWLGAVHLLRNTASLNAVLRG